MYISPRAALVRNVSISAVNGSITLVILLIAPLGLMAVIANTLLVAVATYTVATAADQVIAFLQCDQQTTFFSPPRKSQIRLRNPSKLDRRQ